MKHISTNRKSAKKALLALSLIIGGCIVAPVVATAQAQPFGFENNSVSSWVGTGSADSVSVNSDTTYTRTGLYSLKLATSSTLANEQWNATATPYDSSLNNPTIFFIYWAKADTAASADASFLYSSFIPATGFLPSNANGAVPLTTTGWTRVTNSVSGTGTQYYFPAPRKTTAGAASVYMDDGIMYTSATPNAVVDTVKPGIPGAVTGLVLRNLVTLDWISDTDNAGGTGVQATIILRNSNTAAAAPILNDQAQYSVTGGAAGPDTVAGGWQIVSATTGATAISYLDPTPAAGNYIYAVVLRDIAYNYSAASVSGIITTGTPVPTILVNQTGFTGSFDTVAAGTSSATQQYTVSAYNLTGNLVITAMPDFQVATGTAFTDTINIAPVNGMVPVTTINVRLFSATATGGALGYILNTSANANTVSMLVQGDVIDILPTTTGTLSFGKVTTNSVVVNLPTVGNGNNRVIAVNQGNTITYVPANGVAIRGVNADYQLAAPQGNGNRVIYDGSGSGNDVVTVTGLTPNTLYSFAVYEYNEVPGIIAGTQDYLHTSPVTALIKTDSADFLAVNNIPETAGITIYPNPVHGTLYIQAPVTATAILCDVTGRIVYTQENATTIDVGNLANGLYILTLINDKGVLLKREKVMVQ